MLLRLVYSRLSRRRKYMSVGFRYVNIQLGTDCAGRNPTDRV